MTRYRVEPNKRDRPTDWRIERTGYDTLVRGSDPDFLWKICDLLNAELDAAGDSQRVNGKSYHPGSTPPT